MSGSLALPPGSDVALAGLRLLIEASLRASGFVLVAASVCLALRRGSAAMRHLAWTIALSGAVLVVPASRLLPTWSVSTPAALSPVVAALAQPGAADVARPAGVGRQPGHDPSERGTAAASRGGVGFVGGTKEQVAPRGFGATDLAARLILVWALGVVILAGSFIAAALRLASILQAARRVDDERTLRVAESVARDVGLPPRGFRLRWTDTALTPMTWGLWRPVILLPSGSIAWTEERLRQVLTHEMAHVVRHDALTQALSAVASVVHWFNPLVWWAARRLVIERERACDDWVLRSGARASAYASDLLEIARLLGARWTAARISPAMARRSQISGRLLAVLDPDLSRSGVSRRVVTAGVVAGLVLLVPLAALSPAKAAGSAPLADAAALLETPLPGATNLGEVRSQAAIEDARGGIAAAQRALSDALRRGDAAAMAQVYAEDAVSVVPGLLPVRGRRSIQDAAQRLIDQGVAQIETGSTELFLVGGKVCETGRAVLRTRTGVNAGALSFMTLWTRENGQWRILRDYVTPEEVGR